MRPRAWTVWALRYGVPGVAIRATARRGDLIARTVADPALRDDPFPAYEQLRGEGVLTGNRLVHATVDHRAANAILRSDRFFAGPGLAPTPRLQKLLDRAIDPWALGPDDPPSLLAIEPPDHTRLRRLVSSAFTPRRVAGLATRIEQIAHELLADRPAGTPFDLVADYAAPLPVIVIAELLGVPSSMRAEFIEWGNLAATTLDPALTRREYAAADRALRTIHAWLGEHVQALRRQPGDDLLSRLVHLADGGDALTDTELRATAFLLLGAGFETTVNLIGNAAVLLMQHRDQLDRLLDGEVSWSGVVEETLRFDSPVQVTLRTARTDTEVEGVPVAAGRSVVVMLGGANRDPAVFTDPQSFDVGRPNAREHLAFSAGIHYCLGAQLARSEGEIALRVLFEHAPDLRPAGPVRRRSTRVLRGYEHLQVVQPASSASRRSRNRRSTSLDVSTNASS